LAELLVELIGGYGIECVTTVGLESGIGVFISKQIVFRHRQLVGGLECRHKADALGCIVINDIVPAVDHIGRESCLVVCSIRGARTEVIKRNGVCEKQTSAV